MAAIEFPLRRAGYVYDLYMVQWHLVIEKRSMKEHFNDVKKKRSMSVKPQGATSPPKLAAGQSSSRAVMEHLRTCTTLPKQRVAQQS